MHSINDFQSAIFFEWSLAQGNLQWAAPAPCEVSQQASYRTKTTAASSDPVLVWREFLAQSGIKSPSENDSLLWWLL